MLADFFFCPKKHPETDMSSTWIHMISTFCPKRVHGKCMEMYEYSCYAQRVANCQIHQCWRRELPPGPGCQPCQRREPTEHGGLYDLAGKISCEWNGNGDFHKCGYPQSSSKFLDGFSRRKTNHFGVPHWLWNPPFMEASSWGITTGNEAFHGNLMENPRKIWRFFELGKETKYINRGFCSPEGNLVVLCCSMIFARNSVFED